MADTKAKIIKLLDNMSEEQLARVLTNISPEYTLPESVKGMEIGEGATTYGTPQDGTIDFAAVMDELRSLKQEIHIQQKMKQAEKEIVRGKFRTTEEVVSDMKSIIQRPKYV